MKAYLTVAALIRWNASSISTALTISLSIFLFKNPFQSLLMSRLPLIWIYEESLFSLAAASAISCYLLILSSLLYTASSLFLMDLCRSCILFFWFFNSCPIFFALFLSYFHESIEYVFTPYFSCICFALSLYLIFEQLLFAFFLAHLRSAARPSYYYCILYWSKYFLNFPLSVFLIVEIWST